MVNIVQDTSKEIVDLFYNMKQEEKEGNNAKEEEEEQEGETPFLTAGYKSQSEHRNNV